MTAFPFVIIFQSDLLSEISSVVVAPFARADRYRSDEKVFPKFLIADQQLVLRMTDLAALPRQLLRGAAVANLSVERHRIVAAIDRVFLGV